MANESDDTVVHSEDSIFSDAGVANNADATVNTKNVTRIEKFHQLTGMTMAEIALGLGVKEEHCKMWATGHPIKIATTESSLNFWYKLACEVEHKLGRKEAKIWWETSHTKDNSPVDLFMLGLDEEVHNLVVAMKEPEKH